MNFTKELTNSSIMQSKNSIIIKRKSTQELKKRKEEN